MSAAPSFEKSLPPEHDSQGDVPLTVVQPEGEHRVSGQLLDEDRGIELWGATLDSGQALTVQSSIMRTPDVIRPAIIVDPETNQKKRSFDMQPGVIAYCQLIVPTGTTGEYAGTEKLGKDAIHSDLTSGAVRMLDPLGIADGSRNFEAAFLGLRRNGDISDKPLPQGLANMGDAIGHITDELRELQGSPNVVFGSSDFFGGNPDEYGFTWQGPRPDQHPGLIALTYDDESDQARATYLSSPETRAQIAAGTLKLGALAMLSPKGEFTLLMPKLALEDADDSPYPCALFLTRQEQLPIALDPDSADGLKQVFTSLPEAAGTAHRNQQAKAAPIIPDEPRGAEADDLFFRHPEQPAVGSGASTQIPDEAPAGGGLYGLSLGKGMGRLQKRRILL